MSAAHAQWWHVCLTIMSTSSRVAWFYVAWLWIWVKNRGRNHEKFRFYTPVITQSEWIELIVWLCALGGKGPSCTKNQGNRLTPILSLFAWSSHGQALNCFRSAIFLRGFKFSAHQIGSDFSRDLITGKPDDYYQIFTNNKIIIDYFPFLIINQ